MSQTPRILEDIRSFEGYIGLKSALQKSEEARSKLSRSCIVPIASPSLSQVLSQVGIDHRRARLLISPSTGCHPHFFFLYRIARPPCAREPLPMLLLMEQTGLASSECMLAKANESVLCPK